METVDSVKANERDVSPRKDPFLVIPSSSPGDESPQELQLAFHLERSNGAKYD